MPRSAAQSDFVVYSAPSADAGADGTPADAEPGALPTAELRSHEASATATRWVMGLTVFMLIALVVLCVVGPHIPAGE